MAVDLETMISGISLKSKKYILQTIEETIPFWIDTGFPYLNYIISGSCDLGLPGGRVVELYSDQPSEGKSTLALTIAAAAQLQDIVVILIDVEYAYNARQATMCGLDPKKMLYVRPGDGPITVETIFDLIEGTMIRFATLYPGKNMLFIWDSLAAAPTKNELEAETYEDIEKLMGIKARKTSQSFPRLTSQFMKYQNAMLLVINQGRTDLKIKYGDSNTTPGGRAGKFIASLRIELKRVGVLVNDDKEKIGITCQARVEKSKIAPPFREITYNLYFDYGIDKIGQMLNVLLDKGVLIKSGSWITMGDVKLGQGVDKARDTVLGNVKLQEELKTKLREALHGAIH